MNLRLGFLLVLVAVVLATGRASPAPALPVYLDTYRLQGVELTDATRGRNLWYRSFNERSCTSCHGDNPGKAGKHARTGKRIKPMAPSVNPARYQEAKKIEKWFLRNCKWTLGRECSLQEKADILTWLASQ